MIEAYNLGALFDPEFGGDRAALIDCRRGGGMSIMRRRKGIH
jgi:hypothetical protein